MIGAALRKSPALHDRVHSLLLAKAGDQADHHRHDDEQASTLGEVEHDGHVVANTFCITSSHGMKP